MTDLIEQRYNEFVDHNFIIKDDHQIKVLKKINSTWMIYNNKNFFKKIFRNDANSGGVYLYGSVGIGKTFIINIFIKFFKNSKKFHFNQFMQDLHFSINTKNNKEDKLNKFIKSISLKYKIVFIDELHIYNIVDALIIKKVFLLFKKYNVFVITSSNFKPEELYQNGLQRNDFIPFISFINKEFQVIFFDQEKDYRRQLLNQSKTYFSPINENTQSEFKMLFNKFIDSEYIHEKKIKVKSREIILSKCLANITYCSFNELCCENLGPEDYQRLALEFTLFFIEKVPKFNTINSNECRRFINLIDMLYDQKRSVVILAESPINKLCLIEDLKKEFERTSSRLYEMTIIRPY